MRIILTLAVRCIACILLSLTLSTCSFLFPHPPHSISAKRHYPADAYVLSLARTQLLLAKEMPNSAVAADLAVLETYTAKKKHRNPAYQPVVIIEYGSGNTGKIQKTAAPISLTDTTSEFPALLEIIDKLPSAPYTLRNIRSAVATIAPAKPLTFSISDAEQTKKTIDDQMRMLLQKSVPLVAIEDVRVQIRLTDFFMHHRMRDAAYLSLENAKQSLAAIESSQNNQETIKTLSSQLEKLESELHSTLPYGFDF